jgi:hypothetical protein
MVPDQPNKTNPCSTDSSIDTDEKIGPLGHFYLLSKTKHWRRFANGMKGDQRRVEEKNRIVSFVLQT